MPEIGEIRRSNEIGKALVNKHRYIWAACEGCGKERWVKLSGDSPQSILCHSCATRLFNIRHNDRQGGNHWNWKGGTTRQADGYIEEWVSPEDFFHAMSYKGKSRQHYVSQHRLVMARYLNRCLLPWEVVHHKNGIKYDNRIENLELLPHGRFHLSDMKIKSYIKSLEDKINILEQENSRLKYHTEGVGSAL